MNKKRTIKHNNQKFEMLMAIIMILVCLVIFCSFASGLKRKEV